MSLSKNFTIHVDCDSIIANENQGNSTMNPMSVDSYCTLDAHVHAITQDTAFNVPVLGVTQVHLELLDSSASGSTLQFYSFWGVGGFNIVGGVAIWQNGMILDVNSELNYSEVFQLYFALIHSGGTIFCRIDPQLKSNQTPTPPNP